LAGKVRWVERRTSGEGNLGTEIDLAVCDFEIFVLDFVLPALADFEPVLVGENVFESEGVFVTSDVLTEAVIVAVKVPEPVPLFVEEIVEEILWVPVPVTD
jgi:hypothetical protein